MSKLAWLQKLQIQIDYFQVCLKVINRRKTLKTRSDCNGNRMLHLEEFLENLFRQLRAPISENDIFIILYTYNLHM